MEQVPESRPEKIHRLSLSLQKTALFVMSFLVIISFMMTNLLALFWQSSDWLVGAVLPGVVATLTNEEREKYNLAPLSRNPTLDTAARMKAEHMAAEEYFAHDSPGGITPWYWFERAGYVYAHAGENLAIHFQDSDEVVKAWMNSPTHKANVVGRQYTEIGIGTAKGRYKGHPTVFVVQLFGTPALRPVVVTLPVEPAPVVIAVENTPLTLADNEEFSISRSEEPALVEDYGIGAEEVGEVEGSSAPAPIENTSPNSVPSATPVPDMSAFESDSVTASFVATSSGLVPYLDGEEFVAGTTAPRVASLATQPRNVLQGIYFIIGSIVVVLLVLSIILGYRTHHVRTVLIGVGLLLLMSLLFVWHIAITAGAIIT